MQETSSQMSNTLNSEEILDINLLRQKEPPKELLDKAKIYLTNNLRIEYFDKVDNICNANLNLAKYKGIIKHDINRQLSTIASRITMHSIQKVEDFGQYIDPELRALESIFDIINVAEENPNAIFNIEDLRNSISLNSFKVTDDTPKLTFDLAVLFSIRTLLLNAKTEAKDKGDIRLHVYDDGLKTHFVISDNSSTEWPTKYLNVWNNRYQEGVENMNNVTEITTGGAGLVAYTSGQRTAKFGTERLVNYVNASKDDFKYVEVIFPHQENQLEILS